MVYAVPLPDGSFGVAQAVAAMMVNVIYAALFSDRLSAPLSIGYLPRRTSAIALTATWRQALNRGEWTALGVAPLVFQKSEFPNEQFAQRGYVGAKHYDAGLLVDFLAAWHGLEPWNVMTDEDFFDKLIAPGVSRPTTAVVLSAAERDLYRRTHFDLGA